MLDSYLKLMQFAYVASEIIPYHKSYKKSIFRKSAEWAHETLKSVVDELEVLVKRLDEEDARQMNAKAEGSWEELVDEFDAERSESEPLSGARRKVSFCLREEQSNPEPQAQQGDRRVVEEGALTCSSAGALSSVRAVEVLEATAPPIDRLEAELLKRSAGSKQVSELATAHIRTNFLLESAGIKPNALERASRESKLLLTSAQENLAVASNIESREAKLLIETSKLKLDNPERSLSEASSSSRYEVPSR